MSERRLLLCTCIIYERILMENLMEVVEGIISEEQGGFQKGKGCMDQIFVIEIMVEEYLGKDETLYVAFIDLEQSCD